MAAKIGILGEDTTVAVGTVTVYTVPASKAARVRILFVCEGAADTHQYAIAIGAPGSEWHIARSMIADIDTFSGVPNDAASMTLTDAGIQEIALPVALTDSTVDKAWIMPLPVDYFLSTGDTVKVKITGNTLTDQLIQVQGVEDDA